MARAARRAKTPSKEVLLARIAAEHAALEPLCHRLVACLTDQLNELIDARQISLGHPLEARVKTHASIVEKVERKAIDATSIDVLDDLVGLRIILLYQDDLETTGSIIRENFEVLSFEDTSTRLGDSQFGYQSDHYVVKMKSEWEAVPTYRGLSGLKVEIQVRTMAQHI